MILDFSASINPLGPPPSAIAAIQSHLSTLRDYPDPNYGELRQALSQTHGLPIEWILPGNGSAELLTWASRELAELAATYLLTPAFGDYRRALNAFGATVQASPLDLHVPADAAPQTALTVPLNLQGTACGLLLNNPHNPTGRLFSRDALLPYLEQFELVVVDEAFMDFLPPAEVQSVLEWVERYPNLVVLRSLTKFYTLPGLRLGYAIAHPDRLRRWQQWRDPWSVNSLAAAAAVAVLQDYAFQQQTLNWVAPARLQLFNGLQALPGLTPYPGVANYLLVQSEQSTVELQKQLLLHHQMLIRDCMSFPELGDRFFRVAVRLEPENQRLLTALKTVLGA